MDFYSAQDSAKRKTKYLILFYLLMLAILTLLASSILTLVFPFAGFQSESWLMPELSWRYVFNHQHLQMLLWVGAFVFGGALISSFIKSRQLAKGGAAVAASIGAVKLLPNSRDLNERKALNVVEEMAIASGMPVPEVFILREESAINAFAAGHHPSDAVIGLTQGCIEKLSREQLQGVIGHEFSHILNGDMRLNLRLIMLLHGVEFIGLLGRILTSSQRRRTGFSSNSRSRNKSNGGIIVAGLLLRFLGWFGVLAGNMVQAAVSRQREFLADASAVQFTRNPGSIADALKVIGGSSQTSKLSHTEVNEMAHMFFGQAFRTKLQFLFATHPPIELRIKRVQPRWDGQYLPVRETTVNDEAGKNDLATETELSEQSPQQQMLNILVATGVAAQAVDEVMQKKIAELAVNVQDPMEAMALVIAVLLSDELTQQENSDSENSTWLESISHSDIKGLQPLVDKQLQALAEIKLVSHLPLVELSISALKTLSESQYKSYKNLLQGIIDLDGKKTVFEQSVFQMVTRYLDKYFGLAVPVKIKYKRASQVALELQLIFSVLVYYGDTSKQSKKTTKAERSFLAATHNLMLTGLHPIAVTQQEIQLFQGAVNKLIYCHEKLKHKIVESLVVCIEYDGLVDEVEKELVLAIAATIDAPIPRLSIAR